MFINWIRNFFNTDKWWGKTIFILVLYFLYWFIFYGSWVLMPNEWFEKNTDLSGILFLIYIFLIVPSISFFIPPFIKKIFSINKIVLYLIHIFFVLLSIAIFLFIAIISAVSNIQIG